MNIAKFDFAKESSNKTPMNSTNVNNKISSNNSTSIISTTTSSNSSSCSSNMSTININSNSSSSSSNNPSSSINIQSSLDRNTQPNHSSLDLVNGVNLTAASKINSFFCNNGHHNYHHNYALKDCSIKKKASSIDSINAVERELDEVLKDLELNSQDLSEHLNLENEAQISTTRNIVELPITIQKNIKSDQFSTIIGSTNINNSSPLFNKPNSYHYNLNNEQHQINLTGLHQLNSDQSNRNQQYSDKRAEIVSKMSNDTGISTISSIGEKGK